jgi:short-subunit dehydrogenase
VQVTIACPGPVATEISDGRPSSANAGIMSARECARQIVAAAERGRRELIMTWAGKLGVLLRPFFPGLVDQVVRKRSAEFFVER